MIQNKVFLFGIEITYWPKWLILIVSIIGIMISFLLQGMAQETLYVKYKYKDTIFFTLIQFLGYFIFSSRFFFDLLMSKTQLKGNFRMYLLGSIFLCCSMLFSNLSVEKLSYPTAVLFKSSKLIPVMIGGYFFLNKRYSIFEIISILSIVIGLVGISLSDKYSKNQFNLFGVFLSTFSLICDAVASSIQEKALDMYGASQSEVITMLYFIGSIIIGIISLFSGQLIRGIKQCIIHPPMMIYLGLFAFLGAIGVQFVYTLIKLFGSIIAVMVTSVRKSLTVCISYILFPNKKFTLYHLFSMFFIIFGIIMNTFIKKNKNEKKNIDTLVLNEEKNKIEIPEKRRRHSISVL